MLGGLNFYHLRDIKSFLFFSTICYLIAYYCIYIISVSLTVSLISAKMIVKKFYKNKNSDEMVFYFDYYLFPAEVWLRIFCFVFENPAEALY